MNFTCSIEEELYTVRAEDGVEIGPCSGQTIAVLLEEGVLTDSAQVVGAEGPIRLSSIPRFGRGATARATSGPSGGGKATRGCFAELLADLWSHEETGRLEVVAGDVRIDIDFEQGVPVSTRGGTRADTLGCLLVRMGRLTETQHADALEALLQDPSPDRRIEDVLVELRLLDAREVVEALRSQNHERLLTCFSWTEVKWELDRSARLGAGAPRWDCDVSALIAEGIRRHNTPERAERQLIALWSRYPRLRTSVDVAFTGFEEEAAGWEGPTGSRDSTLLTEWADAAFRTGMRLYRSSIGDALQEFRKAVQLRPDVTEYELMVRFVELLLEPRHERRLELAADARDLAGLALRENQGLATAHKVLGHLERYEGRIEAAAEHYRRAALFAPHDRDAAQLYKRLELTRRFARKPAQPSVALHA